MAVWQWGTGLKKYFYKQIRSVFQSVTMKAKAAVCKTHNDLPQKVSVLMNSACRARTRYCIQSLWSQTVPVGGRRRSPLGIIQLSNMNTPHRDVFGTILFFNRCMIPGWFPPSSSVHPPPSSILPSLCFCLSGPVPISKPWGVDSSIHENWGLYACPGSCFFLLKKLKVLRESCCLAYRWASIKEVFIQNVQPPQAMVWYTAEHKQGFKWSSFHPEHQGWRG